MPGCRTGIVAGMLEVMLVHLDTDLGGDTDDACALALLLGQAGVELAGITTVADRAGRRASAGEPNTTGRRLALAHWIGPERTVVIERRRRA